MSNLNTLPSTLLLITSTHFIKMPKSRQNDIMDQLSAVIRNAESPSQFTEYLDKFLMLTKAEREYRDTLTVTQAVEAEYA